MGFITNNWEYILLALYIIEKVVKKMMLFLIWSLNLLLTK